jgi:hypothetical protein
MACAFHLTNKLGRDDCPEAAIEFGPLAITACPAKLASAMTAMSTTRRATAVCV